MKKDVMLIVRSSCMGGISLCDRMAFCATWIGPRSAPSNEPFSPGEQHEQS
jgi:hypothetical protein